MTRSQLNTDTHEAPTIDVGDLAKFLDVSENTIWRWVDTGLIGHHRLGPRLVRFTPQNVDDFISRSRVEAKVS